MLFLLFGNMVLNVSFIHMLLLQCRLWCDAMEYYIGYKTISCRVVLCGDYHYYGMWGNSMWEITCGEYPVGNTLWVHLVGIPFIGYINRENTVDFSCTVELKTLVSCSKQNLFGHKIENQR